MQQPVGQDHPDRASRSRRYGIGLTLQLGARIALHPLDGGFCGEAGHHRLAQAAQASPGRARTCEWSAAPRGARPGRPGRHGRRDGRWRRARQPTASSSRSSSPCRHSRPRASSRSRAIREARHGPGPPLRRPRCLCRRMGLMQDRVRTRWQVSIEALHSRSSRRATWRSFGELRSLLRNKCGGRDSAPRAPRACCRPAGSERPGMIGRFPRRFRAGTRRPDESAHRAGKARGSAVAAMRPTRPSSIAHRGQVDRFALQPFGSVELQPAVRMQDVDRAHLRHHVEGDLNVTISSRRDCAETGFAITSRSRRSNNRGPPKEPLMGPPPSKPTERRRAAVHIPSWRARSKRASIDATSYSDPDQPDGKENMVRTSEAVYTFG